MSRRKVTVALAAVVLALLFVMALLQDRIDRQRFLMGFHQRLVLMPGNIAGSLVLAGFRGLAADLLWLQIEDMHHQGKYHQMLPLFRTVTFLQPHFITPWAVGGWHMAYNVYHRAETEEEKAFWVQAGIEFLEEGIRYNPDRYDLYFELGWTYYHKVEDYGGAVRNLEHATRFPRPEYVDNLLAHAYFRNGQEDEAMSLWRRIEREGGLFSEVAVRLMDNVRRHGHPTRVPIPYVD